MGLKREAMLPLWMSPGAQRCAASLRSAPGNKAAIHGGAAVPGTAARGRRWVGGGGVGGGALRGRKAAVWIMKQRPSECGNTIPIEEG